MTRKAASLTGALIARKGAAKPWRPERGNGHADSMSRAAPAPAALSPKAPKRSAGRAKTKSAAGAASADKRSFTLRLTPEQHLRMRLASVHLGQSAQHLLIAALDEHLARVAPRIKGGRCLCINDPGFTGKGDRS